MVKQHTTVSPPKCQFAVFVCQSFLRWVRSDPGAPSGNNDNTTTGGKQNETTSSTEPE